MSRAQIIRLWRRPILSGFSRRIMEGTPAYLGPVTSTYTVRDTERYPFSILPFGVTAMRAAVGRLQELG